MKRNHVGRRSPGALLMWLGGALMAAALCLWLYNAWDDYRAQTAAQAVVMQLTANTAPQSESAPESTAVSGDAASPPVTPELSLPVEEEVPVYVAYPEKEMPLTQVAGHQCLGLLEIPALERTLPVLAESSDASLKYAPGCYAGSVYQNDMVIAGHNYTSHFGRLRTLQPGDAVYFTDADGNRFAYEVADLETLNPTDIEGMTTGDWDLTLFTCTYGNRHRLAVRCFLIPEN